MPFNPSVHHRRSIRMQGVDYSAAGANYVTICSKDRTPLLGSLTDGVCVLSQAGQIVNGVWLSISENIPGVELDTYVIMPDHFHAILHITEPESVGAKHSLSACTDNPSDEDASASPLQPPPTHPHGTAPGSLGAIVQNFKSVTTRRINNVCLGTGTIWQRNYYERIIRNEKELIEIRQYIDNNPKNAADDPNQP